MCDKESLELEIERLAREYKQLEELYDQRGQEIKRLHGVIREMRG